MIICNSGRRLFLSSLLTSLSTMRLAAHLVDQDPPTGYVPKQSDRPQPLIGGDEPGFQRIFDGKTLQGWEGDSKYWRVADGCMIGEITPQTIIKSNTFIVWKDGEPTDFELKVDYRITSGGNTGINYRSKLVPDPVTPENRFAMRGYQCDLDGKNQYSGNNYEEKGRLFLAVRGQVTRITGKRLPVVLSMLGNADQLASVLTTDWNSVHIIARGNILMHSLNGWLFSVVVDDDNGGRMTKGLIGVQVHVGGPMKVEYKNWRLKTL